MMRRLRTCVLIVSSTLLLSLCLVSAEEQKSNLESKNILSENNSTKIEENESKPEIEHHHDHLDHQDHNLNELKTDEHNNIVHDDNHVQDDHHDHVDGHVQDDSVDDEDDHVHDGKIVEPSVDRDDLITVKKDVHADVPTKIPPPWDPLSSVGKPPPTRPPYRVSFTPYTTPTPLPNRPDWKKSDWLNYFKTNHPNFWFINELKKNYTEEHGIKPEEEEAPWVSVDHAKNNSTTKSEFDYSNWKNWTPAEWLKWSNSKEYKDNYLNRRNPYLVKEGKLPFKIHDDEHPEDDPDPDVRNNPAIFMTLFKNPAKTTETTTTEEVSITAAPKVASSTTSTTTTNPRDRHFPKPTVSPTKDPHYVYKKSSDRSKNPPLFGLSNEYIVKQENTETEKPKTGLMNSFDEGRYEFRPARFRQNNPILLSGSSLFGSNNPVSESMKSSRQAGGSSFPNPVNLENILIRSKNVSSDESPSSLGQFTNPTSYSDYIANLERLSGVPVLGNLANTPAPATPSGSATIQLRPPGPGRPSYHFSEGYVPPPYPYAAQPQSSPSAGQPQNPPSFYPPGSPSAPPAAPPLPEDKSSSTSTSTSGGSNAQSSAAAAGPGASTSTSTTTGQDEEKPALEETENNNVYYPCDEGIDCPEETEAEDYNDNYDDYVQDLNAAQESDGSNNNDNTDNDAIVNDAIVVESNDNSKPQLNANQIDESSPDSFYDYGEYPSFENCTSLEECLGVSTNKSTTDSAQSNKLGADLMEYYYDSGDSLLPGDNVVSKPIFTPDGQKILNAANSAASVAASASPDQLDNLINSLTSLVRLLNTTKTQGNDSAKPNKFRIPPGFGSGQMGNVPLPAFADDSLLSEDDEDETLLDEDLSRPLEHVGGLDDSRPEAQFKIRAPLPIPPATTLAPPGTTIPPHLIPLGPDGEPLLNPDGTPTRNFQASNIPSGQHVSEMFPFLDPSIISKFYETTPAPALNVTEVDNRDAITRLMNLMHELPMDTRRRMLAGMVFTVPMAAATMAAVGVPSMLIAPLATVIPGFLFSAFMETDPNVIAANRENRPHRRRGIAGLVDAVQQFRSGNGTGHGHGHGDAAHGHDHGHGHGHGRK